ncbi:hypothetical protein HDU76_003429 [Blyttiomyces sp. JEL0837]|nr:hypothetical protein HDU76_003429 [Blyttiomyces sp. JEL0837]
MLSEANNVTLSFDQLDKKRFVKVPDVVPTISTRASGWVEGNGAKEQRGSSAGVKIDIVDDMIEKHINGNVGGKNSSGINEDRSRGLNNARAKL